MSDPERARRLAHYRTLDFYLRCGFDPERAAEYVASWADYVAPDSVPFSTCPRGEGSDEGGVSMRLPSAADMRERAGLRAWDAYRSVWAGGGV